MRHHPGRMNTSGAGSSLLRCLCGSSLSQKPS